jgi:hypothetical protein
MKQIKIPFSLEEYNKGGYEVKRGNLDARIICTNANNKEYPIIALVLCNGTEFPSAYSIKGEFNVGEPRKSDDLFLIKQEFEDGDIIYSDYEHIAVFKKYSEDKTVAHTYIFLPYLRPFDVNIKYFKLASKKEKSLFLAKLAFNSKKWNDKTKQIEDMKQEFEDGDIITSQYSDVSFIFPYRGTDEREGGVLTEVFYCTKNCNLHYHSGYDTGCGYTKDCRIATAEEKQLFFNALAKEGKTWNPQTKQIEDIKKEYEFHLKDWCLMRCEMAEQWTLCQFSHVYDKNWVVAVGGNVFSQCIPYNEETKYLLGTADDCPDKYKTW